MSFFKRRAQEKVDSLRGKIEEIGRYIFENPEVAYQEYKACELLTSELTESGFEVVRGIAGLPTAFKAIFKGKGDGPKVAILAEYDALPDLGHGCGHNLSAASAMGAALALSKIMIEMKGTLLFLGTPGEEGVVDNAGGKIIMIDEFKGLDAAMMMLPWNQLKSL